jgi:hypothetical protein
MDQDLDLSVPLGTLDGHTHLKGKAGKIQKLWARHSGLRIRIYKLQAQLSDIENKLLQLDPSFFQVRTTLAGSAYFPFRPELKEKPGPEVASRNAIILQSPSSLTAKQICLRLDAHSVPIPETWGTKFPTVTNWKTAYAHRPCRKLVQRMISGVRGDRNLR